MLLRRDHSCAHKTILVPCNQHSYHLHTLTHLTHACSYCLPGGVSLTQHGRRNCGLANLFRHPPFLCWLPLEVCKHAALVEMVQLLQLPPIWLVHHYGEQLREWRPKDVFWCGSRAERTCWWRRCAIPRYLRGTAFLPASALAACHLVACTGQPSGECR
jgi:hypothetical protein